MNMPAFLLNAVPAHRVFHLDQRDGAKQNLLVKIHDFVSHLLPRMPERTRDLIEIAAFVYGADRMIKRGDTRQLEYSAWAREMVFCIPVRDPKFWQQLEIIEALSNLLTFISGDKSYVFHFEQRIGADPLTSLFHAEEAGNNVVNNNASYEVALFSGGLDSLAGIISLLETTSSKVVITSHRANHSTTQVQKRVYDALEKAYPNRLRYHPLECTLKGLRASEETQRTRFFLYTAVGYALAGAYGQRSLNIFENGITSINLSKRQDLINARASRTTHPKTIGLLNTFYESVAGAGFTVKHPFLHLTKTEVVGLVGKYGRQDMITSTVTCTKTFLGFKNRTNASHCGYCSQCVDRRFAVYANRLEKYDAIYDFDLATETFPNGDARTHVIDYIRHAHSFATMHFGEFCSEFLEPLADLTEYLGNGHEENEVVSLHQLYHRHTTAVQRGYRRMADKHDPIFKPRLLNSIYEVMSDRRFQRDKVECLANDIAEGLSRSLPIALASTEIKHENALNDQIQAYLVRDQSAFEREYPAVRFSFSTVVPDHSTREADTDLFIEAKYIRKSTPPSKITDQLAADLMKYPSDTYKLFVVYDPERRIKDDFSFKHDFEQRSKCTICIVR